MIDYYSMPDELPEKPVGWKMSMVMHMNMGRKGHMGVYSLTDDKGRETPINKQYNTKEPGLCGFTLPGVEPCMSWEQLQALWPTWIARARAKQDRVLKEREAGSDNVQPISDRKKAG